MTRWRASWWGACVLSSVIHGGWWLRACESSQTSRPVERAAISEDTLPVSLVGAEGVVQSRRPLAQTAAPEVGVVAESLRAAPSAKSHHRETDPVRAASSSAAEGAEGPESASAVPRALIKAIVLMASHDTAWMQCTPNVSRRGVVQLRADESGHLASMDARSEAVALHETLTRALAFLSYRSFASRSISHTYEVIARCSMDAALGFEVADSATAQSAHGHVRFDNGARVDFDIHAQK